MRGANGDVAQIRVGLIGCGRVAWERHLPALRHVPGLRVTAVADVDGKRLSRQTSLYSIPHAFTDYRALIDSREVDAVGVLTPTASHCEIGLASMEAGKPLLLEKPLALTLEEGRRLVEAARRAPAACVLCFNLRWHRLIREARELLRGGLLGSVAAIRSAYLHNRDGAKAPDWHRRLALGGGVSFNEAVHHFDLWRYLLGVEIREVFSWHLSTEHFEDETSTITARLGSGALASGVFSFRSSPNSEVEILGEKGRLLIGLYRFDGLEFYPSGVYPGDIGDRLRRGLRAVSGIPRMLSVMRQGGEFQATFVGVWRHFRDCVARGIASECRFEDGQKTLEAALAAVESARTGRAVAVGSGL